MPLLRVLRAGAPDLLHARTALLLVLAMPRGDRLRASCCRWRFARWPSSFRWCCTMKAFVYHALPGRQLASMRARRAGRMAGSEGEGLAVAGGGGAGDAGRRLRPLREGWRWGSHSAAGGLRAETVAVMRSTDFSRRVAMPLRTALRGAVDVAAAGVAGGVDERRRVGLAGPLRLARAGGDAAGGTRGRGPPGGGVPSRDGAGMIAEDLERWKPAVVAVRTERIDSPRWPDRPGGVLRRRRAPRRGVDFHRLEKAEEGWDWYVRRGSAADRPGPWISETATMKNDDAKTGGWWGVETVCFRAVLRVDDRRALHALPRSRHLWHQRAGETILQTGRVITTDSFSYTFPGKAWPAHAWLAEVAQVLLTRLAGFDGVLLAAAATIAGLYAWVARRWPRRACRLRWWCWWWCWPRRPVPTSSTRGPAAQHLRHRLDRRADVRRGGEAQGAWRLLALLPLLVVWTNVHGAVLGGLTIGLGLAGWTAWRCCAVSSCATPSGPRRGRREIFRAARGIRPALRRDDLRESLRTLGHRPRAPVERRGRFAGDRAADGRTRAVLAVSDPASVMVLVFAVLYVAALAGVPWKKLRVTWLLPLVWLLMTFSRIRHGPCSRPARWWRWRRCGRTCAGWTGWRARAANDAAATGPGTSARARPRCRCCWWR